MNEEKIIVPKEALRFRVVANSNTEYDQFIKIKVKEKKNSKDKKAKKEKTKKEKPKKEKKPSYNIPFSIQIAAFLLTFFSLRAII